MKPRNAATLIICSEKHGFKEVLMLLRHPGNAFVPSAWVFPGGAVDAEDAELVELCAPLNAHSCSSLKKGENPAGLLPYYAAAIRETFEETGLLYAYKDRSLISYVSAEESERFEKYRKLLADGSFSFKDIIIREGLILAVDLLDYYDRWVTPPLFPIRYDARFFLTREVPSQRVRIDNNEVVESRWISPQAAVDAYRSGNFDMVLPTVSVLKKL